MLKLALLTVALLAVSAAPASATVLVHAPVKRAVCGDAITVGIWAQPATRGSRTVRIQAIDRRSGRVWWRKKARARGRSGAGWRSARRSAPRGVGLWPSDPL